MNKIVQRIVTLLLVVLLTCGMFPTVFAADAAPEDTTTEEFQSTEAVAVPDDTAADPAEPTDPTEPTPDTAEPAVEEEVLTASPITIGSANMEATPMLLTADDIALAEANEVKGTHYQRALIWLSSDERLEFIYNGREYSMKTLVTHGVLINGKRHIAYCIDPGVNTTESSGAYEGSETAWTDLDIDTQAAIGLAILYGAPNRLHSSDLKTQLTYEAATQIVIHEIRLGYRSTIPPYECTNSAMIDRMTHSSSAYRREISALVGPYASLNGQYMSKTLLREAYDTLSARLASHYVLPSFASRYNAAARTYELTEQSDGTYAVTLTDTNGILADCTFQDGNGLTYSVSGNELTITADVPFEGIKSCALVDGAGVSKQVPNLESETFLLWNADGYQRFVSLQEPVNDPLPLYFNVSISNPNGTAKIVKKATNGGSVKGWAFEIRDSSGTVIGNYITDDAGIITVGLPAGTYTVTETTGSKEYWINDTNSSQAITIVAGETASVTFTNQYIGAVEIHKRLADPSIGSVAGWTFAIYIGDHVDESALMSIVTTGDDGTIAKKLEPGIYTIMEQIPEGSPYYCTSPNPQTVTVTAGSTASVTFTNAMRQSGISVQKVDHTGIVLAGAEFLLEYSADNGITWSAVSYSATPKIGGCSSAGLTDGKLITGNTGLVAFTDLYPDLLYRLTETKAPNGYQMLSEPVFEGTLSADQDLSLDFTVTNIPIFRLPETGSNSLFLTISGMVLCCIACVGVIYFLRKKEA